MTHFEFHKYNMPSIFNLVSAEKKRKMVLGLEIDELDSWVIIELVMLPAASVGRSGFLTPQLPISLVSFQRPLKGDEEEE